MLLDDLAEVYFRKYTKKLKTLKDLDKSIIKVYRLMGKVAEELEKILKGEAA